MDEWHFSGDPADWTPTEDFLELPSKVSSLTTIGGRAFAILEDGRTVDISTLSSDPSKTISH